MGHRKRKRKRKEKDHTIGQAQPLCPISSIGSRWLLLQHDAGGTSAGVDKTFQNTTRPLCLTAEDLPFGDRVPALASVQRPTLRVARADGCRTGRRAFSLTGTRLLHSTVSTARPFPSYLGLVVNERVHVCRTQRRKKQKKTPGGNDQISSSADIYTMHDADRDIMEYSSIPAAPFTHIDCAT